jgi:formylglycine-generating enzyme required for sulfatase activity
MLGTPDFLAPEQAEDARSVDIRADIYSLGCTLYFLLTGRVPYPGGSVWQKLRRHHQYEAEPIESVRPTVPQHVCVVVRRMMAKSPTDRYDSPGELAHALEVCLSELAPVEPRYTYVPTAEGEARELTDLSTAPPEPLRTPTVSTRAERFVNSVGIEMVLIPAGRFSMGSPPSELSRGQDEQLHDVTLTRSFFLGVYPITQLQYAELMGRNPAFFKGMRPQKSNRSRSQEMWDRAHGGPNHPVECVYWNDAVAFCEKLNQMANEHAEGRVYRLPTEAEWEYACRAGTTSAFWFGDSATGDHANFNASFPYQAEDTRPALNRTTPVGSYKANVFGLYDVHGNVWEWCQDGYESDYVGNSASVDPMGNTALEYRVLRGGSWREHGFRCRSACRMHLRPTECNPTTGFRIACTIDAR